VVAFVREQVSDRVTFGHYSSYPRSRSDPFHARTYMHGVQNYGSARKLFPKNGSRIQAVHHIMASILAARKLAQFDGGARVPPQSMQLLMPCDGLNRSWRKSIGVLIVGDSFHARVSDLEQTGLLAIAILAF
jgi:hypothetical protein